MGAEVQATFNKMTSRITGVNVYNAGATIVVELHGTRGYDPDIIVRLDLETAKLLAAMLVSAVKRADEEQRSMHRMLTRDILDHLPHALHWLVET